MSIKIKRSTGDLAPASLAAGQLAYSEGQNNGGTLYYGEIGGTVREIGGRKYMDKLNGIEAGAQVNTVTSVAGKTGAVVLVADDITTALGYFPINSTAIGAPNGVAGLDGAGLVPASQLPSYVDDVLEFADSTLFPVTGESAKIYVAVDTGKVYRWSGSVYVEIVAAPGSTDVVTEGLTNLYFTTARARSAISATQNITYDSATGVITGPDLSSYALTSAIPTTIFDLGITDGTIGQVLTTNGAGVLSFITPASGGITSVSQDTAPTLGGDLDVNGKKIISGSGVDIVIQPGSSGRIVIGDPYQPVNLVAPDLGDSSFTISGYAAYNKIKLGGSGQDLDLKSDSSINLTPGSGKLVRVGPTTGNSQLCALSGSLTLGYAGVTSSIVLDSADPLFSGPADIQLNPYGTGNVKISGISYPNIDGTTGQVMTTNGAGVLSFTDLPALATVATSGAYADLTGTPTLVTAFTGLTDVPSAYTAAAGFYVKVNAGATALEFSQDVDDGVF